MRTIQRNIVGPFIFSADDKLLLGHSGVYEGRWVVSGGGVDEGETLEETGIDLRNETFERLDGEQTGESEKTLRGTGERVHVEMVFVDYIANMSRSASEITLDLADDFTGARWFDVHELQDLPMSPPTEWRLINLGIINKESNDE